MKNWKWWHIVALIAEIAGLGFIVLNMATDLNDDLFLVFALGLIGAGNVLTLVMNIRRNRKNGKE